MKKKVIYSREYKIMSVFLLFVVVKEERRENLLYNFFDLEERILAEMTIEVIDYFRLKRYLKKYNIEIVDNYEWS